ncbi:MAG TPA: F0F1 ATP synthase subunit alpha [Planctomycetaceae bacterium]|nr:F0F1 ATP synthase subunit alpha [Planctomycetaceae bacterium]
MPDHIAAVEEKLRRAGQTVDLTREIKPRGVVRKVGDGVALISGLPEVRFEELLAFDSGAFGMAFELRSDELGAVLLGGRDAVCEGEGVIGTGRLPDLGVGPDALGRILDPLGNPLDDGPNVLETIRLPLFRPAPEIIERRKVDQTLWTGVLAVDAAIPIGRGQRELIIGDRDIGKTALAIDFVAAQRPGDVVCVYVVIGQPMSRVLGIRDTLERAGCLSNTALIAAPSSSSPGLQYLAPYAGASVAEYFRDRGGHVLVVYDDLTKHADAYRELALLLGRPPGREAFPGDIFHIHAELLERAAALSPERGGGSVTAFPLVETSDGDISAYIPTNLISITDGQIFLEKGRFERDLRPAIDIGRSVSRIGAVAQPPAMRAASKNFKIELSRIEALEKLSRVGLDIDIATQATLKRGNILRALLRQPRLSPRGIAHQVIALTAAGEGWLDEFPPRRAALVVEALVGMARGDQPDLFAELDSGKLPSGDWKAQIHSLLPRAEATASETSHEA